MGKLFDKITNRLRGLSETEQEKMLMNSFKQEDWEARLNEAGRLHEEHDKKIEEKIRREKEEYERHYMSMGSPTITTGSTYIGSTAGGFTVSGSTPPPGYPLSGSGARGTYVGGAYVGPPPKLSEEGDFYPTSVNLLEESFKSMLETINFSYADSPLGLPGLRYVYQRTPMIATTGIDGDELVMVVYSENKLYNIKIKEIRILNTYTQSEDKVKGEMLKKVMVALMLPGISVLSGQASIETV